MKSRTASTIVAAVPVISNEPFVVQQNKIPVAAKMAVTAFLAALVPIYWHTYGLTYFLWFCDTAFVLTVLGMWLESSLLISMCSVGILFPQCLWLVDFGSHLLGVHFVGLTGYMFDPALSLFIRGLLLFHGWLPLLLIWLLLRLGYDKRALPAWTCLAAVLMFVCYFFTPPAGTLLANSRTPINLNYLYGFNDRHAQAWISQNLYVMLWFGALWLVALLPTHLVLRKIFAAPRPAAGQWPHRAHWPSSPINLRKLPLSRTQASTQPHN